jgi:hypothetical protein
MTDPLYEQELLADGRIIYFRFKSAGAEAAETWFNEVTVLFDEWNTAQKPMLLLFDLLNSGTQLSPEALKHGRDISQMYPDNPGKTAFLIDSGDSTFMLKTMIDHLLTKTRPSQIFTDKDAAVAWLLAP